MLRRIAFTAVSVIALAGGANAQNYAAVNWSGLYGGVNAGYGWGSSSASLSDNQNWTSTSTSGICAGGTVTINGVVQNNTCTTTTTSSTVSKSASKSFDSTGGFGGGQIGYNMQNGRLVFGVEADIQGSGISGSTSASAAAWPDGTTSPTSTIKAKSELDDFGTLRGRLGYTFEHTLVYVTGGLAYGNTKDTLSLTEYVTATTQTQSKTADTTRTGYVLGAGAEYFLNPAWSVKAEYQYIDLGSETLKLNYTYTDGSTQNAKLTADHTYNTVRVGLNYHVGAVYAPLK